MSKVKGEIYDLKKAYITDAYTKSATMWRGRIFKGIKRRKLIGDHSAVLSAFGSMRHFYLIAPCSIELGK